MSRRHRPRVLAGWVTAPCLECDGRGWWTIAAPTRPWLLVARPSRWLWAAWHAYRPRPCRFCCHTGRVPAYPASRSGHHLRMAQQQPDPLSHARAAEFTGCALTLLGVALLIVDPWWAAITLLAAVLALGTALYLVGTVLEREAARLHRAARIADKYLGPDR